MKSHLPYAFALMLPAALGSCVMYHTAQDGLVRATVNETVLVGPLRVMPLAVLEDSRCAAGTQCVWAGQVRIRAQVSEGAGVISTQELTSGKPLATSGGTVTLVEVYPDKRKDLTLYPEEYRFGFRFDK